MKEIGDTKGTFHARMGTIKDRNGMDLKKQKRLRRGGRNTQKNYTKKDLNDPDSHNGVVPHVEPDILECEGKWALGSITRNKARRGEGIPAKLFQILKDDAVKVLHSWLQSKSLQVINAGEGVEKREPSYTVGGNAN